MTGLRQNHIEMIRRVARHLGSLRDDVVFAGGCVAGLLIADEAAPEVRPTYDVDVIVELVSRQEYYELENKLRDIGFVQRPQEDGLLCRWEIEGIKVDIMPTRLEITGITNRWFKGAWKNSFRIDLDDHII